MTSAGSTPCPCTRTSLASRSTSTASTPPTRETSPVTAARQCSQLMPPARKTSSAEEDEDEEDGIEGSCVDECTHGGYRQQAQATTTLDLGGGPPATWGAN